jgi:hypothetical protein
LSFFFLCSDGDDDVALSLFADRTSLARKVQKGFENHDMQSKHAVRLRSWKMATSGESMDRKL